MVLRAGGVNLPGVGTGPTTTAETPTKVLCLTELITADELMDDGEYEEILEDMREEGEKFGVLVNAIIPRPSPNGGEQVPGVGKAADGMKKGKAMRRQDLPVSENVYGGMTEAELSQALEKELQLAQQDIKIEQTKDRKNMLESYVYETRSKLLNTYRSFATKLEKEGISRNLQQTEDWLYDDGVDEFENIYSEKLDDLKKLVDPIENRYKDEDARAQATRGLLNCIVDYQMAVGSLPPSERDAVVNECNKAEQWLQEKTQRQDSLPKNADPILWSSEIKRKADALDAMCKHIMRSKASGTRPEDTMEAEQRNKQDDMRVD